MKNLHWLLTVLALAVIVTGCAYNGDESGSGGSYHPPSHTGHHH